MKKKGFDKLITQTTELIQERQHGKWPLYLNITGGYKGALPYPVLLGLAFGGMNLFYLFEQSDKIIRPPKLPVGFDLLTWRNYRAFLRSIPHIEGLEEEELGTLIPDNMRVLLEREKVNNRFPLTALGKALYDQYEGERGKEISEYGRGYLLTDEINDPKKRQALKNCIDRWQYLWIGDLIPETVEHARGHAQRDLELLAQIIYPILNKEPNFFGEDQTDDNLLVLLSSIWLHDLGHSGDYLKCKNTDGTIKDGKTIKPNIKGFPSLVRDLHHLLSWYLIGKGKEEANTLFTKYLFSWENVPGNDSERLLRYLMDDLNIDWAENAEIRKFNDGMSIRISKDANTAEIMIDENKEKAKLKITDSQIHDLKVKTENGKLNIYPRRR